MNKSPKKIILTQFLLAFFTLFISQLKAQQGLVAEYYDGRNFDKKVATRIDSKIDFNWMSTPPVSGINPHNCSIRWLGKITAPESGTYTFSAKVDDGIRVWISDKLIIDAWDLHDMGDFLGKITLEKGKPYDLKVEYFNALIEGEIRLLWELPSEKPVFGGFFGNNAKVIDSKYFQNTGIPIAQKDAPKSGLQTKQPPLSKKPIIASKTPSKPVKNAVVSADTIQKYIPKNVMFQQSKSIMLPESFVELDNLAAFLKRYTKLNLTIEGHTDVIGDQKMNKVLSEERALAVAQYLINHGVNENRIVSVGYGSTRPIVADSVKTGNRVNRRVAFIIK
jgi:outer membrane protein OmpA-like peptidoglycan-associated protein